MERQHFLLSSLLALPIAALARFHQPISPELEKFYKVFCETGYLSEEQLKHQFMPEEIEILTTNNPIIGPPIDIDIALAQLR